MKTLYPTIEPYHHFHLAVSELHSLYVEVCGNPEGIPVLFVHGGPGAGAKLDDRCFFNPEQYRIILFDQRGCGRSTPLGEITANTTTDLIADIESIRAHLAIEKWLVFGGSWGSTLSLVYAQAHVNRVLGLILRGVFFAQSDENHWLWQEGLSQFYPEAYRRYKGFIAEEKQHDLISAYYELMKADDEITKNAAAIELMRWESAGVSMAVGSDTDDSKLSYHQGLIEAHYCANACFLKPKQIAKGLDLLLDVPVFIVNGRYDMLTPPRVAYELHRALPQSRLQIVDLAGHASKEPAMIDVLVTATDDMWKLLLHVN